ncbi:hypothetical protein [Chryseobacterium vrystaatense]|uniref:Uncharacterized protein n=1 Tax=Chryseobacterium vrystaatense TaxID=307480 RepID=A0ABR4UJ35_9FLAO|nr:hypothetical protein [Chryseobacterium vrystaatense]KFF24747.1 hypothetical protein IW16_17585 [Chryseobacterium vrystaatense]
MKNLVKAIESRFYRIFFSEPRLDSKLEKLKYEFFINNLSSEKLSDLQRQLKASSSQSDRIEIKLRIISELKACIDWHMEAHVW